VRRAPGTQRVLLIAAALLLAAAVQQRHAAARKPAQVPVVPDPALELRIDVNRASAAELEALPGIGPARAAAIVARRERHGPFASLADLAGAAGLGGTVTSALEPCVVFR
jgi:competence protein ComEA